MYRWDHRRVEAGAQLTPSGDWHLKPGGSMYYAEIVLELVRLREFPAKPSRRTSIYAWLGDVERARGLAWAAPGAHLYLYEVTLPSHVGAHIGDIHYWEAVQRGSTLDGNLDAARQYWALEPAPDCPNVEVVSPEPFTVTRLIEERTFPAGGHY